MLLDPQVFGCSGLPFFLLDRFSSLIPSKKTGNYFINQWSCVLVYLYFNLWIIYIVIESWKSAKDLNVLEILYLYFGLLKIKFCQKHNLFFQNERIPYNKNLKYYFWQTVYKLIKYVIIIIAITLFYNRVFEHDTRCLFRKVIIKKFRHFLLISFLSLLINQFA